MSIKNSEKKILDKFFDEKTAAMMQQVVERFKKQSNAPMQELLKLESEILAPLVEIHPDFYNESPIKMITLVMDYVTDNYARHHNKGVVEELCAVIYAKDKTPLAGLFQAERLLDDLFMTGNRQPRTARQLKQLYDNTYTTLDYHLTHASSVSITPPKKKGKFSADVSKIIDTGNLGGFTL